jgi:hypothetical protein
VIVRALGLIVLGKVDYKPIPDVDLTLDGRAILDLKA